MCRGRVVLISKIISANHAIVWGIIERNIFMNFISKFGHETTNLGTFFSSQDDFLIIVFPK